LDAIEQRIYMINENKKLEKLTQMMTACNPYLSIIFCNTKDRAAKLSTELLQKGFNLGELHGDLTQGQRTQVLRDFSTAKTQYLVATDIAARGIDIQGITHIFNYDVPHDVDYYIHRIGRTGRAGQTGIAITFATPLDTEWVRRIERHIEATITKYTIDGKVKVKAATTAPKKEKIIKNKSAASTYQATKAKAAKQAHGGGNNRRRRVKDSGDTANTQRRSKR
jgi:ATP-dependent RNA helicase DeaD